MPDIGASLRAARTSAGIDISDIEAETKIRAKYLRALENEEWNQLPGPTYVRGFLRTYGDALGLDGRLLVEEYKLHHQAASEDDMRPIQPPRQQRGKPPRRRPVWGAVAVVAVVLVGLLWLLGQSSDNGSPSGTNTQSLTATNTQTQTTQPQRSQRQTTGRSTNTAAKIAEVRITATAPVFICAVDLRGRRVLDGITLQQDQSRTLRSKLLRIRFGNSSPQLIVGGRRRTLEGNDPLAYRITADEFRKIPFDDSPSCGS